MKPGNTSPPDVNEEIAALIETLHQSEQRLEELTAGEVDTVTNRAGRTVMLQRAQEQLRVSEAAKQAAILNALPAHIALLDSQGCIISVNETWRRFAGANALLSAEYGIDLNYLEICDSAEGKNADEATQAAAGIRSVLAGTAKNYSLEYPCHSPTEQRWFLMTVTPVDDRQNGAVVMHLDITERKLAEQSLRASEAEFHTLAEAMPQIVWITRADGWNIYFNQQWMDYTGLTLEESLGHGWNKPFHPDEQQRARDAWEHATKTHDIYSIESRLRRADGVYRWWLIRGAPLTDANGNILKWLGTCTDIHDMKMLAQLLEAERSRLVAAQRIAKVGSWETDLATFAVIWSEQTHRIFETDPRKFKPTHQAFLELVHPDDRATVDDAFFKSLEQSSSHNIEHRILMPDGRIKFVEEHWQAYFDDQAHPVQAIGTIQDITDRKAAETRIKYLNRVYAVLSGINTLIVRAHDQDELFNEACRIAVEAGGFRMAMIVLVDKNSMKIVPVTTVGKDEELVTAIKNILSSGELASSTMVARAIREKQVIVSNDSQSDPQVLFGNKYAEAGVRSIVIFPLIVADEAIGALALYADAIEFFQEEEMKLLTELASDIAFAIDYIEKQKRINYLAYYDVLTGLANRSLFLERVEQFIRNADNGHRIAVFLIDLERFKSFNDSFGQKAGDNLLKHVADWLSVFSQDASLVARIDADHFAAVIPQVASDVKLAHLVDKVLAFLLENSFEMNDAKFRTSAKIGVALFPDDGTDAETLFKHAEAALKMAKKNGDRYLFHTRKMTEAVATKLTLENQLRQAIDNEEFVLHYQPKVNLASGMVTSAEALIRWNDPRTGLVPPGKFIPILEETGLIFEVGRWALRQAIADNLRWQKAGLPAVRIAVNVSPLQLRNSGFITEIERNIGIDKNAADGLELEITESMIMTDINNSISILGAIRKMGVTIAVDDFGTGFSSLGYLSKLPVDTLKIDRSFVVEMSESPEGLALVSTIISLAHALKLKVVAEGVETEEQSQLLRLLGCDEMQGYLFSKPVPAEIFESSFLVPARAARPAQQTQ